MHTIKKKFYCTLLLLVFCIGGVAFASVNSNSSDFGTDDVQQQKRLTGTVKDAEGPVVGVTVSIKGTTTGAMTDLDGLFTLNNVSEGATIVVSSVGYVTQEIKYTGQESLDITLESDVRALDEVVVTALGIEREKKSLGYAVSAVKGSDLTMAGVTTNPLSALYGKASGVGISASSSGPTGGINIKIRGAARLDSDSSTRPLFVVDGVPIYDRESSMTSRGWDPFNSFDYGAGINDINPEDIESMEILKGAKASVLYGSEGANGVVLITTKKGTGTRGLGVTLDYKHTWEEPVSYIDYQNEYGAGSSIYALDDNSNKIVGSAYNWGTKFDGRDVEYWDGSKRKYVAYPDNYKDIFRTGSTDAINVALAGGNEKGNMRIAYTNYNFAGLLTNHTQQKHTFSFSGRMQMSQLTTIEVNSNFYKIRTQNRYPNIQQLMSVANPRDNDYQTVANNYLDKDGYRSLEFASWAKPAYATRLANFLWQQNQNKNLDSKTHLVSSIRGTFQVHPLVKVITLAGVDFTQTDYTRKDKETAVNDDGTLEGGKYRFDTDQNQNYNLQGLVNFEKAFVNDRLRVLSFVGGEFKNQKGYNIYVATLGNFINPGWYSIENSSEFPSFNEKDKVLGHARYQESKYSMFGQATFSWDDKYYLEFNARNDWASTLPRQNNSYFYPGISFNWNFSEDVKWNPLTYGNLRMSWADVGAPANRYFANNIFNMNVISGSPGPSQSVEVPESLFSGVLKPERKREYEIGIDARFFDQQRLQIDFSYYTGSVYDQIMSVPLTSTTGFKGIKLNAGEVKNWGYELVLKGAILADKKNRYRWDVTLNLANQFSKVKKLYPGLTQIAIDPGRQGWKVMAYEGERIGQIVAHDYRRDEKGNRIIGSNGLYSIDPDKTMIVGNSTPDLIGGFSTDFYYKNFSVRVGFDYSFGGRIISQSNYYLLASGSTKETLKNRDEARGGLAYYVNDAKVTVPWEHNKPTPNGERIYHDGIILPGVKLVNGEYVKNDQIVSVADYWRQLWHDNDNSYLQPDFIYKNNYIKLREVALLYTLPKKISESIKLQKVTFSLTARNLCYLYKSIKNIDSESVQGTNSVVEYSIFPSYRTWGFGINVSF